MQGYLDLKGLSLYSSYSVSVIRKWLKNSVRPLPYYMIGGKILIKVDEFDQWMVGFKRVSQKKTDIEAIVNSVFKEVVRGR